MTETILLNRLKWINFLKEPTTKKAQSQLVSPNDAKARCCLGHGCHTLGLHFDADNRTYNGHDCWAPPQAVDGLGLWNHRGSTGINGARIDRQYPSLSHWNDSSDVTPQQIGEYLGTVILGGATTPFQPLSDALLYNCCTNHEAPDWNRFDALELGGCVDRNGVAHGGIDQEHAEFFTIYGHLKEGGCEEITDVKSFEAASAILKQFGIDHQLPTHVVC